MDINSPISTKTLLTPGRLLENTLNLKVGQKLDAKVINANIEATKNAVALSIGDKNITVQSNQPLKLNPEQQVKIQVTQTTPTLEFKVLEPLPETQKPAIEIRLKLISTVMNSGNAASSRDTTIRPTSSDSGNTANSREPMRQDGGIAANIQKTVINGANANPLRGPAMDGDNSPLANKATQNTNSQVSGKVLPPAIGEKPDNANLAPLLKQPLDAKIIGIIGNKIQLQIIEPDNKQTNQLNIDRSQITNAPPDLKAGQNLSLQITKTGSVPEFKIVPNTSQIPEAKVAEFVKQFLPRHEASPVFLNQLIQDLPQLMQNKSVPQALKDIAQKIIQNLPPKEQLVTSQGLKQAMTDSGLFLEAKLTSAISQNALMNELPQLVKNENVPQSLQRIAVEIMQNLTQKQPPLNKPSPEPEAVEPNEAEATPAKLNPPDDGNLSKPNPLADAEPIAKDFKTNLLKFIQALKQEISVQSEQAPSQTELDLLKNLQHKTENTVAKLVLEQLASLPKDDSPKQVWLVDIPFIDRQHAESVRIEVQQDKENRQQAGGGNWSVNITITPPELGTIHCIVSYRDQQINTYFKSQNDQTTEIIKNNLDYLKEQLEQSGLKTGHMDAHAETPKTQFGHAQQLVGKRLFDDKA
jgi:uncharacterized protein (UPF0147 family)